jgi:predicted DNA-binding mobile mystery protein A
MKQRDLIIKQLDQQLAGWKAISKYHRPKRGWVRTIRKALGMTGKQLAKKLQVNRSRIAKIEASEQFGAVTLRTLQETADALNCELVYALIPRESLQAILQKQAKKVAKQQIQRVTHTMKLEDQGINLKSQEELEQEYIQLLLSGALKYLWEE